MIKSAEPSGMNNSRLEYLIREVSESVDGEMGAWRFKTNDVLMFCITDEFHDRLRVIAPIANVEDLNEDILRECLLANFDRALDARYCIHDGTLWGAYIHPLSPTTDEQFQSALNQVAQVNKNFGGTFSSGALVFGAPN